MELGKPVSQEAPKIAGNLEKLGREKKEFLYRLYREHGLIDRF